MRREVRLQRTSEFWILWFSQSGEAVVPTTLIQLADEESCRDCVSATLPGAIAAAGLHLERNIPSREIAKISVVDSRGDVPEAFIADIVSHSSATGLEWSITGMITNCGSYRPFK